jgi:hypothetical protein
MATLLAKRPNQIVIAKDDTHLETMAADPSIPVVKEGSSWQDNYDDAPMLAAPTETSMPIMPAQTAASVNNSASALTNAENLVENTNNHWINNKWRPAMGWMYMGVCVVDFVLFPVLWSILQAIYKGNVTSQWQPLTLQGAGLFHLAMGAVLGIAAYGRTKEKLGSSN